MMTIFRICSFLALTVLLVLSLSTCGGGSGDDALSRIKKSGEIVVAISGDYPPFSFYNDKKELVGFDVDTAGEIAKRLGVSLRIYETPWKGIMDGLLQKRCDAILSSMTVTGERAASVNFTNPYYFTRSRIVVLKGSPYDDVSDLKGRSLGAAAGTTFEKDAGKLEDVNVRIYDSDEQSLMDLGNKAIDAVITDEVVALYICKRENIAVDFINYPPQVDRVGVALRKEDISLLKAINSIITEMNKDGTSRRLREKMLTHY